ncbi:MAG: c-type cytochrome [Candidatus Kapabacteria bacterium]|nr:c-type cytochrome [Candidatus Kapabacteria bacterium]
MATKEMDKLLEHDADGIQEYDNALPRWWLYGFYFTIVFGVVYMFYYHSFGGPSSAQEYANEMSEAALLYKRTAMSPSAMVAKSDAATLATGKAIFEGTNNACYTCHRNDMGGQVGPNLTDEYWLHGGSFSKVMESIKTGFLEKGMQPYGTGAKLNDEDLLAVASYVWSKRGSNPPEPKAIEPDRDKKYDLDGNPIP